MVNVLHEIAWIYQNNSGIFYIIFLSLYIDLGYFFGSVNSKTMNFDWFFFLLILPILPVIMAENYIHT